MRTNNFGKLFRSIISNTNSYIDSQIVNYGIKQGQYDYFLEIYNTPGINQLELARLKNVGKASVTKALKILENQKLIKRVTNANDRRNIQCFTTEKGENIVENLILIKKNAEKKLFDGFTDNDKETFYKYLSLFHKNSEVLINKINDKSSRSV